ncbi:MAG: sodium:calcium antiporter [Chitinophagales bacterium]
MENIAILLLSLGIILIGAEVFTNGVEWLGFRLNLSEGAVGSILAAVGTAMPETIIPIIALVFGIGSKSEEVGIGAIIGAPLMLSTLAMFVTGLAIIITSRRRLSGTEVNADNSVMKRDLGFFLIVFTAAILSGLLPPPLRHWQIMIGAFMIFSYAWYVIDTLREEREECEEDMRPCYFAPRQAEPSMMILVVQLLVALGLIIGGAKLFVGGIEQVASALGIPAFVLSLVIAPIATELPEKFNSVIWVSRGKDTLALGNITGAMVFQSSIIPALGIFFSPWHLTFGALVSGIITLVSTAILYLELRMRNKISVYTLLISGAFYIIFLTLALDRVLG